MLLCWNKSEQIQLKSNQNNTCYGFILGSPSRHILKADADTYEHYFTKDLNTYINFPDCNIVYYSSRTQL